MSSPTKESAKSAAVKGKEDEKEATKKSTLELLEEDDEFQEFDSASWEDAKVAETEDNQLWKDDWDDDDAVDDFTQQLRAQIAQASK